MLAPVVFFVYNRLDHVMKSLTALSENDLSKKSELFIFSDGPKSEKDIELVNNVRSFIHEFEKKKRFENLTIIEAEKNKGLANSVIDGVTQIISKYGKIIVIEDDCVTAVDFLSYMNAALSHYQNNKKVWSIGGFTVGLNFPHNYEYDTYVMGRTCSYAWATWIDRWNLADWGATTYNKFKRNHKERALFNKYGSDRSKMLDLQQRGKTNSWAIRFCFSMFQNDMYTIYPRYTKVKNIGYDVGTHNNGETRFDVEISSNKVDKFIDDIRVDEYLRKQYVKYFNVSIIKLFASYCINVILPSRIREKNK